MIDLHQQYGGAYQVLADPDLMGRARLPGDRLRALQIPAKHGTIFAIGEDRLGCHVDSPTKLPALRAIEGAYLVERHGGGTTVLFAPGSFPEVAALLGARKKRAPAAGRRPTR